MISDLSKNKVLRETLSYIKKFEKKVFVIKYGGAAMTSNALKDSFAKDIVSLNKAGIKTVIIHGGGNEITDLCKKLSTPVKFIDGLRYTDLAVLDIVKMVLAGKTNKEIVSAINKHKGNAAGFCGIDAGLLKVKKLTKNNQDLGFVGEIKKVNIGFINLIFSGDLIPVIAPIGTNNSGDSFNINADDAASAIACKLKAEKLIYISDVPGIIVEGKLISSITLNKANELIKERVITNGMIPKIKSAFKAIRSGVGKVHIIDGRIKHSLLNEIFTDSGAGTEITKSRVSFRPKKFSKKSDNLKLAS